MSANATTAMHGQSSQVGLLGAAAILSAAVAFGALGLVIGQAVGTTTADTPAAGTVIDSSSMSGPRSASQKGLGSAAYGGTDFAGKYQQWLAAQPAAAGSDFPDYFQRLAVPAAAGSDFPDYFQRHPVASTGDGGVRRGTVVPR